MSKLDIWICVCRRPGQGFDVVDSESLAQELRHQASLWRKIRGAVGSSTVAISLEAVADRISPPRK